MKKKTLSLILALLMVVSLLPVSALAANTVQSGTCTSGIKWTLDDEGVLTITGNAPMTEAPWSAYKDSIKSVIIEDGVTSICGRAFYECTELTSITMPDSISYISDRAFFKCSSLKSINLPSNIMYLSHQTFYGCSSLESIVVPDQVQSTGENVFSKCTSLKEVVIKGSVSRIEYGMFAGCSSLERVSLPGSVKYIGSGAFYGCDALKEVYFGGTKMQCAVIDVEDDNDVLDDVIVYCALDYPFTDIANSGLRDWISLGQAMGIVNGYPDGTFKPNNPVTRAQYITMLHNMCGKPQVITPGLLFDDTNTIPNAYLDAVKWGVTIGIVNGYNGNKFCPNKEITRAEMAAFSYRLMKYITGGEPTDELKADCNFKDSASIPSVHREAVNVCANLGIIQGFSDGTFRPNATANRGQAATILVRVAASLGS